MTVVEPVAAPRRAPSLPPLAWSEAGEGRPVVLVHGFPADGRVFAGQLRAAGAGRLEARVIAVDLPGFGRTPTPVPAPDALDVGRIVEALRAFLDDHRLERPVVGGLAIGGYVAIELAARDPGRLAGLVLMGTKPAPDHPANGPRREAVAQLALQHGAGAVADQLADEPFALAAGAGARARFRAMIEAADPGAIAALVRGLHRRPDPASALPAIAAAGLPVLVIVGADDPFTRPADARRLAELLPGSRFLEIPGAGHLPPLERPTAVTAALARFLADLP